MWNPHWTLRDFVFAFDFVKCFFLLWNRLLGLGGIKFVFELFIQFLGFLRRGNYPLLHTPIWSRLVEPSHSESDMFGCLRCEDAMRGRTQFVPISPS